MKFSKSLCAGLLLIVPSGVLAQDCEAGGEPFDLTKEAVIELYDCIEAVMAEGYANSENAVGAEYRSWQVTSTRPAVAGPHGERFLQTFANDVAADQYLKFEEEGVKMPVGSVLAKESFAVKNGKAVAGPLFIMTKLTEGEAPDAGNWQYDALMPNGNEMKIQQSFCADCHMAWDYRDRVAYPLEEVRLNKD